jgi:predicted phosphodiesterase
MRIRVLSDLHLEFASWRPPPAEADCVVLAGDIHVGTEGLQWATQHFPDIPVIYVPGNHEYYGGNLPDVRDAIREEGNRTGIHVLDKDEITIAGVRFLGATLWTDFALYGSSPESVRRAMDFADCRMADFSLVQYGDYGHFRPQHARAIHLEQARWLTERLAQPASGATVVVTHHLPHPRSIHPKYRGDPLNVAFVSDLDRLVRAPVALWVHGHTHESMDYVVNATRVVCNPRGYLPEDPNSAFIPTLVVKLGAGSAASSERSSTTRVAG